MEKGLKEDIEDKKRWIDGIRKDLGTLKVTYWENGIQDQNN